MIPHRARLVFSSSLESRPLSNGTVRDLASHSLTNQFHWTGEKMKRIPLLLVGACVFSVSFCRAAIDTSSSGQTPFPLKQNNGPWMVLVKSFVGAEAVKTANDLAQELRQEHKISAYVLIKPAEKNTQVQQTGLQQGRVRSFDQAVVLAGDCKNETVAQPLCLKIRKIKPKSITREMTSVVQWEQGVLATAFLVPNPLAPKPQAETPKPDSLLIKMNTGQYNLYSCPGQYTLQVIVFQGGIAYTGEQAKRLEKASLLEAAGEHAEQVTRELRKNGYEAYVFHARTSSLVTVGSFSSEQDPQVVELRKQLATMRVGSFNLLPNPNLITVPHK